MPVIEIEETFDGRGLQVELRKVGKFPREVRTYVRTWKARTDSPYDTQLQVLLFPDLPRLFSPYFGLDDYVDLGAFCRGLKADQDQDDPFLWKIQADYSSDLSDMAEMMSAGDPKGLGGKTTGGPGSGGFENPLLRPPKITFGFAKYQKVIVKDLNDVPCTNSAGQPFDPPVEIDDSRPVLTVVKNVPAFDFSVAVAYQDAVSTDPFFGSPAGTAKIDSLSAEFAFENGLAYWVQTAVVHFRREGWKLKLLDAGYMKKDASGNLVTITDKYGHPFSAPTLLDGAGGVLTGDLTKPFYKTLTVYKELPFAPLGLI